MTAHEIVFRAMLENNIEIQVLRSLNEEDRGRQSVHFVGLGYGVGLDTLIADWEANAIAAAAKEGKKRWTAAPLTPEDVPVYLAAAEDLPEAECPECHGPISKTCDDCGEEKTDVKHVSCPYASDVNNDPSVHANLCDACAGERAADI